jgi:DNA-binding SARP family transcriptional activator
MDEHNTPGTFPLLRIRLCGTFQMEWIDPATGQTLLATDPTAGSRDRAAAILLLALLLCQPNRQAHRDWVMEQFWPESSRSVAVHRLENIFSCLRKLLRPPSGGESLVRSISGKKSSGPSYCLDAYPKLWVDLDALTWNVEQAARMERFSDHALPFWQRAFDLFKAGPFLADDPYEPYAAWVKEQRASRRVRTPMRPCALTPLSDNSWGGGQS